MSNRIAGSELIINDHGAIYHLDLRPEDIASDIITVGDPERVAEVSKHFDSIEVKRSTREFVTHTGYIGKKRLTVISTGIGTDNIDIVFNELDALVNINFETRTPRTPVRLRWRDFDAVRNHAHFCGIDMQVLDQVARACWRVGNESRGLLRGT